MKPAPPFGAAQGATGEAPAKVDEAAIAAARAASMPRASPPPKPPPLTQSIVRDKAQRDARRKAVEAETMQWRARIDSSEARLKTLSNELGDIEKRRDAAKAAPQTAAAKLAALMEEAGTAEQRRIEASDRVAEAETAARVAGDRARSLEQAHADARERRASADAHAQGNTARVSDIAAQRKNKLAQRQTSSRISPAICSTAASALHQSRKSNAASNA